MGFLKKIFKKNKGKKDDPAVVSAATPAAAKAKASTLGMYDTSRHAATFAKSLLAFAPEFVLLSCSSDNIMGT